MLFTCPLSNSIGIVVDGQLLIEARQLHIFKIRFQPINVKKASQAKYLIRIIIILFQVWLADG
jgi:hypothetical protein